MRIPPVGEDDWDEELRPVLERLGQGPGGVPNVFTTFARHPPLFRRWLGMGDQLLNRSSLPSRTRELVILRTAVLAGSAYEWAQHARIGRSAGLSDEEIARVADGPAHPGWDEPDREVLLAVGELHGGDTLSGATWRRLSGRWDTEQLMDLVMTVGFYTMTAMSLNAFGVPLDPGLDAPPMTARDDS